MWTLRTYVGAISGGRGAAGDRGPYVFTPVRRPFTAVGAQLRLSYEVVNQVVPASRNDLSQVHTVPDPYYVGSAFQSTSQGKVIEFVHLPADCIIRIYSLSGVLVRLLEHHSGTFGGSERGMCSAATTRWWPAACTSITSRRATLGGWDGSRW